ncbi:hypothetical protein BD289DRAFT_433729 [Coniella lustricola]|uniref:Inhibitor I9 domain-containing protein n=1 Tax=Coniella lustricola TaxID=2025994 RepID=A0A2T3A8D7_9PEZI|nr:hypothetical protein BD289DRAFT_433729 [Coniella lustricola]
MQLCTVVLLLVPVPFCGNCRSVDGEEEKEICIYSVSMLRVSTAKHGLQNYISHIAAKEYDKNVEKLVKGQKTHFTVHPSFFIILFTYIDVHKCSLKRVNCC